MNKKIVFTGGLSSGKTTMINVLRDLGYNAVEECSEKLINGYKSRNGLYPWDNKQDIISFHEEVFNEQLKNQQKTDEGIWFFDRSLIDRLAFLEFDGLPVPERLLDIADHEKYDRIFFFEGNDGIYKTDGHRPHGKDDSDKIEKIIKRIYKNLGYELDMIPFCPIEERLKIILEKI